jgi:hypothetical protein
MPQFQKHLIRVDVGRALPQIGVLRVRIAAALLAQTLPLSMPVLGLGELGIEREVVV